MRQAHFAQRNPILQPLSWFSFLTRFAHLSSFLPPPRQWRAVFRPLHSPLKHDRFNRRPTAGFGKRRRSTPESSACFTIFPAFRNSVSAERRVDEPHHAV